MMFSPLAPGPPLPVRLLLWPLVAAELLESSCMYFAVRPYVTLDGSDNSALSSLCTCILAVCLGVSVQVHV